MIVYSTQVFSLYSRAANSSASELNDKKKKEKKWGAGVGGVCVCVVWGGG